MVRTIVGKEIKICGTYGTTSLSMWLSGKALERQVHLHPFPHVYVQHVVRSKQGLKINYKFWHGFSFFLSLLTGISVMSYLWIKEFDLNWDYSKDEATAPRRATTKIRHLQSKIRRPISTWSHFLYFWFFFKFFWWSNCWQIKLVCLLPAVLFICQCWYFLVLFCNILCPHSNSSGAP